MSTNLQWSYDSLSTNHSAYNPQNEPRSYNTKAHLVLQVKIRSFSSSGMTAPVSSSYNPPPFNVISLTKPMYFQNSKHSYDLWSTIQPTMDEHMNWWAHREELEMVVLVHQTEAIKNWQWINNSKCFSCVFLINQCLGFIYKYRRICLWSKKPI